MVMDFSPVQYAVSRRGRAAGRKLARGRRGVNHAPGDEPCGGAPASGVLRCECVPGEYSFCPTDLAETESRMTDSTDVLAGVAGPREGLQNTRQLVSTLPLEGIRVIEFVHVVMGPTCGLVL